MYKLKKYIFIDYIYNIKKSVGKFTKQNNIEKSLTNELIIRIVVIVYFIKNFTFTFSIKMG